MFWFSQQLQLNFFYKQLDAQVFRGYMFDFVVLG